MVDPASLYMPFRGKLIWTYNLIFISIFLVIVSIIVDKGLAPMAINPYIGPSVETLLTIGALQGVRVRSGEYWRIMWAPFLHAGFIHCIVNCFVWYYIGILLEPDWGFIKTAIIFILSAITGNLVSATLDPNIVSVGTSGGIFGVLGASISYVIEYWDSIPRPLCTLITIVLAFCLILGCSFMPYVDNYAHLGGAFSGVLLGFMTIRKNGYKRYKKNKLLNETSIKYKSPITKNSTKDLLKNWMNSFRYNKNINHKLDKEYEDDKYSFHMNSNPLNNSYQCNNRCRNNMKLLEKHKISPISIDLSEKDVIKNNSSEIIEGLILPINSGEHSVVDNENKYIDYEDNIATNNHTLPYINNQGVIQLNESYFDTNENSIVNYLQYLDNIDMQFPEKKSNDIHYKTNMATIRNENDLHVLSDNKMKNPQFNKKKKKLASRFTIRTVDESKLFYIDDSFDWKDIKLWILRFMSAFCLVIGWIALHYYLIVCPTCYTPPGQII